ncbi:hypothetical protein [Metabacillus litoralis]|uniref:hypothetical protein n=1 Tax=Metabacillus litoralis TaxID=152268 RepID=UPI000EF5A004|nr:hypothetical protein [Metabacillus litoralis]MCM3165147.1 hypothetical protein [Metabacillus litoralis]MCM3413721.1 hypothetical protein [Metabacillus litoralis]
MSKTKTLMGGILSAAVALSACSTKEEMVIEEEQFFYDEEIGTSTYSEEVVEEEVEMESEIELDHLQSQYPGMDLEAMEDYMEENNLDYQEEELIAFLDDIYENGESTLDSNYYANESSFPWWIFLVANAAKSKPSGKVKLTKPTTSAQSAVKSTPKPSTKVTSSSSSSSTKSSSGFGSSSTSTGS